LPLHDFRSREGVWRRPARKRRVHEDFASRARLNGVNALRGPSVAETSSPHALTCGDAIESGGLTMKKELSRRDLLGRAGLAIGGVVAFGALACSSEDDPNCPLVEECPPPPEPGPQVANFPYQQYLPAGYQMDVAAVKETAYHGYYEGGCCHGAFKGLLTEFAKVGQPFNLLPIDLGKFGGGGVAGYGSICGAALGGVLIQNFVASNAGARAAMMTDLLRWYERERFPKYVPTAVDVAETALTLDFSAANLVNLGVVTGSHLCHASVSGWCAANGVSASGNDKKARCARLTADVAGKVAEMMNAYLTGAAYTAAAIDTASAACLGCHPATSTGQPVASGMACDSCHSDKSTGHP
jgi:hypothetical protein